MHVGVPRCHDVTLWVGEKSNDVGRKRGRTREARGLYDIYRTPYDIWKALLIHIQFVFYEIKINIFN